MFCLHLFKVIYKVWSLYFLALNKEEALVQRTGMQECIFLYLWGCLGSAAACWPGHPSDRIYPSSSPTSAAPHTQRTIKCGSLPGSEAVHSFLICGALMSSACSSTSETFLIIRQGSNYLSMARGGIYTADLAAKKRCLKNVKEDGSRVVWIKK